MSSALDPKVLGHTPRSKSLEFDALGPVLLDSTVLERTVFNAGADTLELERIATGKALRSARSGVAGGAIWEAARDPDCDGSL
jgi:hypothetical protein